MIVKDKAAVIGAVGNGQIDPLGGRAVGIPDGTGLDPRQVLILHPDRHGLIGQGHGNVLRMVRGPIQLLEHFVYLHGIIVAVEIDLVLDVLELIQGIQEFRIRADNGTQGEGQHTAAAAGPLSLGGTAGNEIAEGDILLAAVALGKIGPHGE